MRASTVIDVVRLAYRFDLGEQEWLDTLAESLATLVPGHGTLVYTFDARSPRDGVAIRRWSGRGVDDRFVDATLALNRKSTADETRLFYHSGVVTGTVSSMLDTISDDPARNERFAGTVGRLGVADSWGLTASSPEHRGIVANSPLESRRSLGRREAEVWRCVGVHIVSGYRLRRRVSDRSGEADAVIAPDGAMLDEEPGADASSARERIARHVREVEHHARRTGDALDAVTVWKGLVEGRWSLVHRYDSDGKRYYLLHENRCSLPPIHRLSERERQVVAYVAQGDSNRWVAYQLGLSPGTVAVQLRRAMRKMGIASRSELIWLYAAANRPDGS